MFGKITPFLPTIGKSWGVRLPAARPQLVTRYSSLRRFRRFFGGCGFQPRFSHKDSQGIFPTSFPVSFQVRFQASF
jgi:hypothetical protein